MVHSIDSAIDLDSLLERCLGNLSLAERAIEAFLDDFPQDLASLEAAANSGAFAEACLVCHRMKGGARNLGAAEIARGLETLESHARAQATAAFRESLDQLRSEYQRLLEAVA